MTEITKKYSNADITIIWKPGTCIHSKLCWQGDSGLRGVFNPSEKPWIKPEGASTEEIVKRIDACPSGALSYYRNDAIDKPTETTAESIVELMPNGPLLVYGNITLKHKDGSETHSNKVTAFCRCGASGNKPFCDGSHKKVNFVG